MTALSSPRTVLGMKDAGSESVASGDVDDMTATCKEFEMGSRVPNDGTDLKFEGGRLNLVIWT